ncbi:hypothetical protein D1871_23470 [Nakamurella silvestris]|nr:hypothetical protein D1871_23470 [Nakamurella silvestris]
MTAAGTSSAFRAAQDAIVGKTITAVYYGQDLVEIRIGDVLVSATTRPFGMIGCTGVGPATIHSLVGRTVEHLCVEDGRYMAIDSGENRLAFPVGDPTTGGPESVRVVREGSPEDPADELICAW